MRGNVVFRGGILIHVPSDPVHICIARPQFWQRAPVLRIILDDPKPDDIRRAIRAKNMLYISPHRNILRRRAGASAIGGHVVFRLVPDTDHQLAGRDAGDGLRQRLQLAVDGGIASSGIGPRRTGFETHEQFLPGRNVGRFLGRQFCPVAGPVVNAQNIQWPADAGSLIGKILGGAVGDFRPQPGAPGGNPEIVFRRRCLQRIKLLSRGTGGRIGDTERALAVKTIRCRHDPLILRQREVGGGEKIVGSRARTARAFENDAATLHGGVCKLRRGAQRAEGRCQKQKRRNDRCWNSFHGRSASLPTSPSVTEKWLSVES